MRSSIAAVGLLLLQIALPRAAIAASCTGEACGALAVASDLCAWTNTGDKSVRLAVSGQASASPVVTVLAPGERYKAPAELCAGGSSDRLSYQASFPTLKVMADDTPAPVKVAVAVPKIKPAVPVAATAAVPAAKPVSAPVSTNTTLIAGPTTTVASAIPLPRSKPAAPPAYPPLPRLKPAAPVEAVAAVAAPPAAPALVEPAADVAASARDASECGEACGEILFKVVDSCVWVQSQNPRPIAFEGSVGGKPVKLLLEGASAAKADERAAALAKAGADGGKIDAAYHTRLHDPFQSAGAGIPVYRVRLGGASACVKSREEIVTFAARFAK